MCAKTAGLLGKQGPWTQYPRRMMQMRARSWALRDVFPDVLRGMPIAEDIMDIEPMRDVTSRRQSGAEVAAIANQVPAEVEESEARKNLVADLELVAKEQGTDAYAAAWKALGKDGRQMVGSPEHERLRALACQCVASEDVPQ